MYHYLCNMQFTQGKIIQVSTARSSGDFQYSAGASIMWTGERCYKANCRILGLWKRRRDSLNVTRTLECPWLSVPGHSCVPGTVKCDTTPSWVAVSCVDRRRDTLSSTWWYSYSHSTMWHIIKEASRHPASPGRPWEDTPILSQMQVSLHHLRQSLQLHVCIYSGYGLPTSTHFRSKNLFYLSVSWPSNVFFFHSASAHTPLIRLLIEVAALLAAIDLTFPFLLSILFLQL